MPREPIYKHMSVCPYTISRDESVERARRFMHDKGVRHLPVLDEGVLVGVVTERDVERIVARPGVDLAHTLVEEALTAEPYIVAPDASVARVAADMARHKYGCAIVVEAGHVAGVFTTVDALRVLGKTLNGASDPVGPRR